MPAFLLNYLNNGYDFIFDDVAVTLQTSHTRICFLPKSLLYCSFVLRSSHCKYKYNCKEINTLSFFLTVKHIIFMVTAHYIALFGLAESVQRILLFTREMNEPVMAIQTTLFTRDYNYRVVYVLQPSYRVSFIY